MGPRLAYEVLLTDKVVTAKEALNCGWANGILSGFDKENDWFDPNMVPVVPKLLKADYRTLTNCMQEINFSKNNEKIEEVSRREGQALLDTWADPSFIKNMKAYLK